MVKTVIIKIFYLKECSEVEHETVGEKEMKEAQDNEVDSEDDSSHENILLNSSNFKPINSKYVIIM